MVLPNSDRDWSAPQEVTGWPVSRRTLLKTGALASGALVIGDASGRAAARRGDRGVRARAPVIDGEDPDPDAAVVVDVPGVPIDDWIVYGDETVADQNPAYDPGDQVVVVVFERLLDSGWPDWRRAKPDALFDGVVARGIKFHAFPQTRLERMRANST